MLELLGIAIILAVLAIANWLLRKWLGRYTSYVLANVVAMIATLTLGDLAVVVSRDYDYSSFMRSLLPSQLLVLVVGLIWLRLNAFKFARPDAVAPSVVSRPAPRPAGRIEPVFDTPGPAGGPEMAAAAQRAQGAAHLDEEPPLDDVDRNFFARYWRGDLSLPFSFWTVGILATVATVLVIILLNQTFGGSEGYNPYSAFAIIIGTWLFVTALTIWKTVGLWRSATRHMRERWQQGRRTFWGAVVKVLLVLSVPATATDLVRNGLPQIGESYNMAFRGDPDLPDYSLRVMRNGTEIEIVGGFKYGLANDLDRVLKASPQIAVVHLDSLGGRIGEAMKVYDTIRRRRLVTYVANRCFSACTVAFAGGWQRWIGGAGRLGFHAPSFPGMSEDELAAGVADQQAIFARSGFDPYFVSRALSTPATSLWTPTTQELFAGGAATDLAAADTFAISGLGGHLDPAGAAENVKIISPIVAAIEERDPEAAKRIYERFLQMYSDGKSAAEVVAALNDAVEVEFIKYRDHADDATTIAFGQLTIDEIKQIGSLDSTICYKFLTGSSDIKIADYLTPELIKREADVASSMIRTAAPRPPVSKAALEAGRDKVMATLRSGPHRNNIALLSRTPTAKQHNDYCGLIAATYTAILQQPPALAAALIRQFMFATPR